MNARPSNDSARLTRTRDAALRERWKALQPGAAAVKAGRCELAGFDPGAKPFSGGSKAQDKASVEALAEELDALQNLFYADRRFKLLVILQGMDAAGKDGTLRTWDMQGQAAGPPLAQPGAHFTSIAVLDAEERRGGKQAIAATTSNQGLLLLSVAKGGIERVAHFN